MTPAAIPSLSDHEAGWEYLFFASALAAQFSEYDVDYQAYLAGAVQATGETLSDLPSALSPLAKRAGELVEPIDTIFSEKRMKDAFGAPGQPGNEDAIRGVVRDLGDVYVALIAWAQHIRGLAVPSVWAPVTEALAKYAETPLKEMLDFSRNLSETMATVVGDVRAGRPVHGTLTMKLSLSISDEDVAAYNRALSRAVDIVMTAGGPRPRKRWWRR